LTSLVVTPAMRHLELVDPSGDLVAVPDPARRPALRRLLAAVAPTLTRLCVRGDDVPPAVWVDDPLPMPSLEVLAFPLLGLSAAHCSALATQCPALRAADVQSISPTTEEF